MQSKCILWDKAVNSGGYPVTWKDNKIAYVHRVLMGAKPGQVVLHSCDNPRCVNKEHLSLGTAKENSEDMVSKGRQAKGEKTGNAKFTEEIILKVRALEGGFSSRAVAAMFNMSKTNVLDIWNKKIWRHI